ncbi:MAG TPA: PQQ-dependent sugar dehydrogenase [Gemmatimonadaceae bacterium]|nr:PQQ-dependent sugar dehydrogenase [Gemmatimonadaceae bacterium]
MALSTAVGLACSEPAGPEGPPQVTILNPAASGTFAGGDVIAVTLSAVDAAGRTLPSAAMEWWVVLHHGEHTHPAQSPAPGSAGTFTVSRQGHLESEIFYRIYARAVDAAGRADTTFVDLAPRLVTLTLNTEPAGLEVFLDFQPRTTPLSVTSVVGMERTLGVPEPQSLNGFAYEFSAWSNDGAREQTLTVPASSIDVVATFREFGVANVAPAIAVSAPAGGSIVTAGTNVALRADASDADGEVTQVEFFVGGGAIGSDTEAPYEIAWNPSGTGTRSITARATDNHGAYTMSSPIFVTVQGAGSGDVLAPTTSLTSPASGTQNLVGSVALAATAVDNVGVTLVQFEIDGELLATDASAPYEATLPSTGAFASGVHVFRARAQDAAGNWSDWSPAAVTFGGDVALGAGFVREAHAGPFGDVLTAAAFTPDGRMFVAEKSGRLRVVKNGQLLAQPFVHLPVLDGGERGLLGVALHPSFETNGYVYLYYTTGAGGAAHNRISRFVASGDVAQAGSEVVVAELPPLSDASKHNGGAMHFGPDGKLYVAVGDDGNAGNGPSLTTPFGKMLRFNADGSIPSDNPFLATTTGVNRAIWARGLRNPFTFAIEEGTGRMHINDVGASAWEEINLGRAGADYGWPATEGPTGNPAYDTPLLAYAHSASPTLFDGLAVVGGAFYRPSVPAFGSSYVGNYFFADYVAGWVYRLDVMNGNAAYAFAQIGGFPSGLIASEAGELFVLVGTRIDRIRRQ